MFRKNKNLMNDSFFDDIEGHSLDKYQRKIIVDNSKYLLVVAGAGSGKTLTIIGKIKYLIEKKQYNSSEILCISFTNETVNNLKSRLKYNIDIYTFHKFSLSILNDYNFQYNIVDDNFLNYVIDEYFEMIYYNDKKICSLLMEYFHVDNYLDIMPNDFIYLKNNVALFIKKIKCMGLTIENLWDCFYKNKRNICHGKDTIFLIVAFSIYRIYMEELFSINSIDFDDMIILANKIVQERKLKRKYRYIIIDEFQDTSYMRYQLIMNVSKGLNTNIVCVGDDFQSIYEFSGCNLDLFVNFKKYFLNGKRLDIKTTYRNSYQLIHITHSFIRKNRYQLRKNINATFLLKYPIFLIYYETENYETCFFNLIKYLNQENKKKVMVLGRYHKDLNFFCDKEYNDMDIRFLTVHESKGLECENIIILNMCDSYMGFPSKIMNDSVFELIDNEQEKYPFAEERRLFYVALTRTKERVYIMVPKNNPSIFVDEIKSKCVELLFNE